MPLRLWISVLIYLVLAVGLFVGSLAVSRWYFTSPKDSLVPLLTPTLVPRSRGGAVTKLTNDEGKVYFSLVGKFMTGLTPVGESLAGTFTIDGDPNKTRVPVMISVKNGTADLIELKKSFDEDGNPQPISAAAMIEKIKKGTLAELYVGVGTAGTGSPAEAALTSAIEGAWSPLVGVTIEPLAIAIVEKPGR